MQLFIGQFNFNQPPVILNIEFDNLTGIID